MNALRALLALLVACGGGNEVTANKPTPVARDASVTDDDLDPQIIKRVVHTRHAQIMACYATANASDPALEGVVHVAFTIGATGDVTAATASGLVDSLDRCVEDEFRQLEFPHATSGKATRVPDYAVSFSRAH